MAKAKRNTKQAEVAAPVVTEVASVATKLTKRNATPLAATLEYTGKPLRHRAGHVQAAWKAVEAALPASAAVLAELPELANPACVSPTAWLSYMVRRGYLAPVAK